MPDRFPLTPGQILIISKEHLRCLAEASAEVLTELDEAAATVRRFLRDAYETEATAFENGLAGQTVHHAHLHLLPAPIAGIPAEFNGHDDVYPIKGWRQAKEHFERHGNYRYMEQSGDRRLIAGHSPLMDDFRRLVEQWTSARWNGEDWIKRTTPEDVTEVGRRWAAWAG